MRISSALRASSAAVMVTAFTFAPLGNLLGMEHLSPSTPLAEAATANTIGTVSGTVVAHDYSLNKSIPLAGATVELRLDANDVVENMISTDASGTYAFTNVPESSYRVCVSLPKAYALDPKQPSCYTVDWSGVTPSPVPAFTLTALPVITFDDGTTTAQVLKGSTFADVGNEAMKDGKVFARGIAPFGNVDTKTLGAYTLTYTAADPASGILAVASRTVNVVDQLTAPAHVPAGLVLTGMTVTPTNAVSSASSVSSTQQQTTNSCALLTTTMAQGKVNDKLEVLKLQTFLFLDEDLYFVRATGVFDDSTARAVRIFQDRHYADVMAPWGIDGNTGVVYTTTERKINETFCGRPIALTAAEQKEISDYRSLHSAGLSPVVAIAKSPLEVNGVSAVAESSQPGKLASWWQNVKKDLLAILPSFNHAKKDVAAQATVASSEKATSVAIASMDAQTVKGSAVASAAKGVRNFLNMTAVAALLAILLGIAAFGFAIYLYRRTRGDEVIEAVATPSPTSKEAPKVPVKPKN